MLIAFNAENLEAVARMARQSYPDRELVLCADNDCETLKLGGTPWNPSKEAASRAAQAVGGKLAICPAHEGKATDFNDLHRLRSLEAVRTVVEEARKRDDDCPMPEGFFLVKEDECAELYKLETRPDGDSQEIRLGPSLFVRGMTRGADGNDWGLMLEWIDPDDNRHAWGMPVEMLFRQGNDWYSTLVSGGWFGNPSTRSKLAAFLSIARPLRRIRCVLRTGWHESVYMLPSTVYGVTEEDSVLQSSQHGGLYRTSGTMEGWREIAELCVGNSRLGFALCAVWGGPEHVRSWRAMDKRA